MLRRWGTAVSGCVLRCCLCFSRLGKYSGCVKKSGPPKKFGVGMMYSAGGAPVAPLATCSVATINLGTRSTSGQRWDGRQRNSRGWGCGGGLATHVHGMGPQDMTALLRSSQCVFHRCHGATDQETGPKADQEKNEVQGGCHQDSVRVPPCTSGCTHRFELSGVVCIVCPHAVTISPLLPGAASAPWRLFHADACSLHTKSFSWQ